MASDLEREIFDGLLDMALRTLLLDDRQVPALIPVPADPPGRRDPQRH